MSASVPTMPEWVTALEAAVLTGASEIVVLDAVRSGRIQANPLSMGKGSSGVLLVRLRDVQALVEEAKPPAAPAPVDAAPAAPQEPSDAEWPDTADIWGELTDPAATMPFPAAEPPTAPAAPSAFAPFSTPVTPASSPPATTVTPPPASAPPVPAATPPIASAPVAPPPMAIAAPAPVAPPVAAPPAVTPVAAPAPVAPPAPARTAASPSTAPPGIWGERPAPPTQPAPAPETPRLETARPRLRSPKTLAAAFVAIVLLAAAVYVARPGAGERDRPRVAGSLGPAPPSVVWMIPTAHGDQIAVVGLPKSGPAVAVAVPSESHVVLPAGDISTVGASADTGPHAQAVAQNVLLKRIGHYLVTTPANFGTLVDALGGITVQTEAPFAYGGHRINPGSIKMKGAMAVAYLSQAGDEDVTGRWEDLLAGVLDAAHDSTAWGTVGESDDPVVVSRLLSASSGATVLEIPTAPASGGGIEADREALPAMLLKFGSSLGSLVRVVVVNGSGAPGLGTLIDGKLAPQGFSVLTSENATHFNVRHSVVVATGEANLAKAEVAAKILGVKSVKVSDQPTSLADITIIVGKDLHA